MEAISFQCLVALTIISASFGSVGDRSEQFQECLSPCKQRCEDNASREVHLPFYLLVFGWSCLDECKYACMQKVTEYFLQNGFSIQKFYGKWPFLRCFGIQEPASVIFSIGNGLGHLFGWMKYRKNVKSSYSMYNVWRLYAMISVNAWFWSTVFHTRDLMWTERLDYFGATTLVLASLYVLFVRTVGNEHKWRCRLFGLFVVLLLSYHCWYLWFVHFDYGYNMKVNVALGVINITGWLSWCIKSKKRRPYVWKCAMTNTMLSFLIALEIWDFPPVYGILDAHALWHFSTIPFCYFWYSFLVDDATHETSKWKLT